MSASPTLPRLVLCELGETGLPDLESFSPFCLKVHRGLKYLGLPYERLHGLPVSFKKYNPAGQVPVLLVGDSEAVPDSTDILQRIQQLAGRTFLEGEDPKLAAEALLWEEFADTNLAGFLVASRFADERNWPGVREAFLKAVPGPLRGLIGRAIRKRIIQALVGSNVWRAGPEACWRRFSQTLDALEARAPGDGFWLGAFSVADIGLFSMLHSMRIPLTAWQAEQVAARPKLTRYLERVNAATRVPSAGSEAPAAH
ncbi:MAG TPA: glutathione S-transferase family protein, partial [Myxococcaceae bacterium]|nr:glutathione S-transferase family protein [Myxococcaceae bacterium]